MVKIGSEVILDSFSFVSVNDLCFKCILFWKLDFSYELDGRVRVRGRGDPETKHWATQTSCHRMDGSYASHIVSDDSIEWRSPDYAARFFFLVFGFVSNIFKANNRF